LNPRSFRHGGHIHADACYEPFVIIDCQAARWMLWYGRQGSVEQIGLALHEGEGLGF
jgi:hypothetical protein